MISKQKYKQIGNIEVRQISKTSEPRYSYVQQVFLISHESWCGAGNAAAPSAGGPRNTGRNGTAYQGAQGEGRVRAAASALGFAAFDGDAVRREVSRIVINVDSIEFGMKNGRARKVMQAYRRSRSAFSQKITCWATAGSWNAIIGKSARRGRRRGGRCGCAGAARSAG